VTDDLKARWGKPVDASAFLGVAFDFALAQPVSTYILPERVLTYLDHGLDEPWLAQWTERHLRPFLDRERARAKERGDRVRDSMTAELQAELRALAAKPVELDPRLIERIVRQGSVRHMLRSVIQETLDRFVDTIRPGGKGGGILGSVGRSAFGFASRASKGILGAISSQLEAQLKAAVTGFVQSSMNLMLDRVVDIIRSPEMRRQMSRSGVALYDELVGTKTVDLWDFILARVDLDDLLEVIPGQLAHNLARPEIREGIVAEVAALLDLEGAHPLSALVEPQVLIELRADVIRVGTPLLSELARSPAFDAWLGGDVTGAAPPTLERADTVADDSADAASATPRNADGEADEPEPADAEPADAEPAAEPADVEPADAEPADVEPADAEPAHRVAGTGDPVATNAADASGDTDPE